MKAFNAWRSKLSPIRIWITKKKKRKNEKKKQKQKRNSKRTKNESYDNVNQKTQQKIKIFT